MPDGLILQLPRPGEPESALLPGMSAPRPGGLPQAFQPVPAPDLPPPFPPAPDAPPSEPEGPPVFGQDVAPEMAIGGILTLQLPRPLTDPPNLPALQAMPDTSIGAVALQEPAHWTYDFDPGGRSRASYPGTVNAAISTESGDVTDFGAIMDGSSHPLSSAFPTLAAAQAVYPFATSLTDEIDWCAIQAAVNAREERIVLPPGTAIINHPITSGATPITVAGGGQGVTFIIQTLVGADGWQHTSSFSFNMFDLDFRCTGACGVGLNLNFTGPATLLTLRSLTITGRVNTLVDYWHDGVRVVGSNRVSISRCLISGIAGGGLLSNVGNAIYLAPIPANPPTNTASFVIRVSDTITNYYQSAIVFDCGGRTGNQAIQGVVLDWVNCNQCMQFVSALNLTPPGGNTSVLELVIVHCQAQTFGASIYAENAQTVTVRDSMFFYIPNDGTAIAAQLPQDCIQINGGGNWWIEANRFVLQTNALVNFFLDVLGSAGGVVYRDNFIYANSTAPTTALGLINLGSGSHHVQESGTQVSFWNAAWPYVVNANANGGTANTFTLGAMGAAQLVPFGNDQLQNQGAYVTYNYPAASGAMALFSSHAAGAGGFNFYNATSVSPSVATLLATITPAAIVLGSGAASPGATIAAIDGAIGQNRILQFRSGGSARWNVFTDNSAEAGSNAGSNLIISRLTDAGGALGNAVTINRASGQIVALTGLTIGSAAGPQWITGSGTPSGVVTAPRGSMFSRGDGAVGTTLYVSQGGTVWNPVAGV